MTLDQLIHDLLELRKTLPGDALVVLGDEYTDYPTALAGVDTAKVREVDDEDTAAEAVCIRMDSYNMEYAEEG